MPTLADHLRDSLRPGHEGTLGLMAFVGAAKADPAILAQAEALLAQKHAVLDARGGPQACYLTARDARMLARVIREAKA